MIAQPLQLRRAIQVLSALILVLATSCAVSAQAAQAPAVVEPATTTPATTLRRGDAGPEVLALQQRLDALGYWLGTPDGSFGGLTEQAVNALQGAAGLTRDGAVGPNTGPPSRQARSPRHAANRAPSPRSTGTRV